MKKHSFVKEARNLEHRGIIKRDSADAVAKILDDIAYGDVPTDYGRLPDGSYAPLALPTLPQSPEMLRLCINALSTRMRPVPPMTAREFIIIRFMTGLTQKAFAKELGVTRNTVARWEMGKHPIPSAIAKVLRPLLNI